MCSEKTLLLTDYHRYDRASQSAIIIGLVVMTPNFMIRNFTTFPPKERPCCRPLSAASSPWPVRRTSSCQP